MSAKILAFFPDWQTGAMTEAERDDILLDAHAAIVEAIIEHQAPDGLVPVLLTLDEAMHLCEVVENLLGPDRFDDQPEPG